MPFEKILEAVERYYTEKLAEHGANPRGVDWNSAESQALRFEQLLKVCGSGRPFSIVDYGCGYGALADFMSERGMKFSYTGYDVSAEMVAEAARLHEGAPNCAFVGSDSALEPADYAVASGIFNVRQQTGDDEWEQYALYSIQRLNDLGSLGFSFNMLTRYSDADRMKNYLYYADPAFFFDYCKTRYSRNVALLHDYGLYEFTIVVRKTL